MTLTIRSGHEGTLLRDPGFASPFVLPRPIDVWLPPGYGSTATRFPVIYMHDGQNLFEPTLAYGGVDWGIDEALVQLMAIMPTFAGAIVVGIWNSPLRTREYMPARPLTSATAHDLAAQFAQNQGGASLADRYLQYLVSEVKPMIDATYRTLPGPAYTVIMGSSMGGLISAYAVCEYPQIFGRAGCLSTHWPIGGTLLVDALGAALPGPGQHRLYFDFGTEALDAEYEPYQQRMDHLLATAGYIAGQDWLTQKFVGADHTERAWRARLSIPLTFLLKE
jgi:predicted alpha/beta superfamily hydrolase